MSTALAKVRAAVSRRPEQLAALRAAGGKVVGWIGYNVPEELIHALGMTPVRICKGGDAQMAEDGGDYFSTQNCFFLRQTVGMFAKNEDPYIQQLDALATDTTCLQLHRMSSVLGYYFGAKTIQLGVPRDPQAPEAREYFTQEVRHFALQLEAIAGLKLNEERLADSLALYQRTYSTIRKLYTLAAQDVVRWREVFEVAHAGFVLDRSEYLQLLEEWLEDLQSAAHRTKKNAVRLLLVGSNIAPGDTKLLDILETTDAEVVGDLLWSGLAARQDLSFEQFTLQGLTDAYLNRFPHAALPCMEVDQDRKITALVEKVRESKAQGVIYYSLRYCDPFSFKMLSTKERLKREKTPLLEVQTDYGAMDLESIRNRVCAFIEMLA